MSHVTFCRLALVCLVTLAVGKGCTQRDPTDEGGPDDGSDDPFASYVPDPDVFCTPPDPSRMIEQTLPGGRTFEFPVNQLILLMNEGTQRSVAEQLATSLGGTIVGQVPEIDFYQLEVPATTRAELDALIAQAKANPNVTSVGYNGVPQLNQTCPAQSDNADIAREDQCPFAETEYYQAVTMFDAFREHLTLHRVRVGVVDTGVDPATGEFDDVDIFYLNNTVGPPEDPHPGRHGTAVAGVIAADDDFSGVNGVASRFLQDNLHLVVGSVRSTAGFIVYTTMAASAGADIINLSCGWDTSRPDFEIMWDTWLRVMGHRSTVLFVCSAGNEMTELTGFNYAPGGIGLPNVITVAATARCEPTVLSIASGSGSAVDIAAPGIDVPVVGPGGGYVPASGTSFSAPMVASLAAILKSIRPTLSPAQVKQYITANAYPLSDGSPFGRLVFTTAIQELLLEMGVGDPIRSWIDPMGLGNAGASGLVLSRICPPGMTYNIDGYGSHNVQPVAGPLGGMIGSPTAPPTAYLVGDDEEVNLAFLTSQLTPFALGSYVLLAEPHDVSNGAVVNFQEHGAADFGLSIAGTLTFDTCRIDERDPWNGVNPWIVFITGAFEGVLEVAHWDGRPPSLHHFDGNFNMPFLVSSTAGDEMWDYLENTCEGGIPRPTAGP